MASCPESGERWPAFIAMRTAVGAKFSAPWIRMNNFGEIIKLDRRRYKVEYVRLVESFSPATLPKEYRVRVQLIEERAQAASPFKR